VRANKVTVSGELEGNIESASQVELTNSGAIHGDLKADMLTVASGSRIRGHVECGNWGDKASTRNGSERGNG
jgi:cytoskeletal protein CcmA (bactofilin family)